MAAGRCINKSGVCVHDDEGLLTCLYNDGDASACDQSRPLLDL